MPGPKYPNAKTEAEWFAVIIEGLIHRIAGSYAETKSPGWWLSAARDSILANHAQLITSRDGTVVYMLRCWLSPPKECERGQHAKYESGNAVLLHWILQPDDIPHLHSHPWEFTTRILAGGYVEERGGKGLMHEHERRPKELAMTSLHDFHRIARHLDGNGDPYTGLGGSWTLVTTGPRLHRWQFWLEPSPTNPSTYFVDAETYLQARQHNADHLPSGTIP